MSVKVPPGGTAILGAPEIVALAVTGVTEDAPARLPAPAPGAVAVIIGAILTVGNSSYE